MIFIASKITDAIKVEISKKLPDDVKIGDLIPLSTGDHVRIEELHPDGRYGYKFIEGPIKQADKSKVVGTVTVPNDPNVTVTSPQETKKKIKNPDPYEWYIKKRLKY